MDVDTTTEDEKELAESNMGERWSESYSIIHGMFIGSFPQGQAVNFGDITLYREQTTRPIWSVWRDGTQVDSINLAAFKTAREVERMLAYYCELDEGGLDPEDRREVPADEPRWYR